MSATDPSPPQKFRDSAAIVLIRDAGSGLEVFWVRRSEAVGYMPSFRAFVGGSVDAEDRDLELEGGDSADRALRACAIREAFEESGVLVGLAAPVDLAKLPEARGRLLAHEATFLALAREHGWRFRADQVAFAGRWQTPPFATARFDTCYYLARVPENQSPSIRPGELESGEWIAPATAIERWKAGAETFAAPILHTLEEIGRGAEGLAERLATVPERSGVPVRRIELRWGIVLHPMKTRPLPPATHTNAYFVGESEMVLVDPGSADPAELDALFKVGGVLAKDGRRLTAIVLTHHHPDHAGGVEAAREHFRVPVAAHPEAARHLRLDHTLADGETLSLAPGRGDWTLRVLHTPGHTRDHLCLLHDRTRSLLTGDHIPGGRGTVIIDPPEGDMAAYVRSLERLQREPIDTLFPGHGSPQGAAQRRIRWMIGHRMEREANVVRALEEAPLPLATLVERAYADTPRELWPYAERSLLAHLLKLEGEGRAERHGEEWCMGPMAHESARRRNARLSSQPNP